MTGKFRRSFASTAVIAAALGLAGCQSIGGAGLGGSERPSKAAMLEEDRQRNIRLAAAAQNAGQHEVALNIYSSLLRQDPGAGDIRAAVGEIYFAQGAYEKALAAFDQALAGVMPSEGARAAAHVGRGRARLASGDPISAERDFVAALALQDGDALAINGLGVAADMQGRHGVAQTRYREALDIDPGNERVRSNLGLSLALAARFDDAIAQLAPLATTSESAQKARYNLALTFGLMGRPTEARELVAAALAPDAADGNGLFYAATRDAVQADAVRASVVRTDQEPAMNLAPHRRLPRTVVNEGLPKQKEAAPAAKPVTAKPVIAEPAPAKPIAVAPARAKPVALEAAPVEPVALEAEAAEPVALEAEAAKPVALEAEAAEPVVLEAAPAEPVVLEAAPVEPVAVAPSAPVRVEPKNGKQIETLPQPADVAADFEPETPPSPKAKSTPSAAAPEQQAVEPVAPAAIGSGPTAPADAFDGDDVVTASKPAVEPAMTSATTPVKQLQLVDVEHLDKNDAFYAAMRVVVDEVNKPVTPWGDATLAADAKHQIASK